MGRPKKEKPNHATGMYEVKVTVGHTFDGKPIKIRILILYAIQMEYFKKMKKYLILIYLIYVLL